MDSISIAIAQHPGFEQGPALLDVAALKDRLQFFDRIVAGDAGEKAEATVIDADDRRLPLDEGTGRLQDDAVAADDQHQVGFFRQLCQAAGLDAADEIAGAVLRHNDQALLAQERVDRRQGFGQAVVAALGDEADPGKRLLVRSLGRVHASIAAAFSDIIGSSLVVPAVDQIERGSRRQVRRIDRPQFGQDGVGRRRLRL